MAPNHKLAQRSLNVVLQSHVKHKNHYNSTTRVPMANKLGWVMTSLDRLLPIMSHAALITRHCEIRGPLTRRGLARKRLSLHRLLFLFLVSVFYRTGKSYFQIFLQLLLWAREARTEVNDMVCRVFLTQVL